MLTSLLRKRIKKSIFNSNQSQESKMALMDFLFGSPAKIEPVSTMTPGQEQLFGQYTNLIGAPMQGGLRYLQDIFSGSPEVMQAFQAPYMRQFQEQTVPGLAERFAGMGSGAQNSSAFAQTLGQAGAGLSENLAALQANIRQNALSHLVQMMNPAFSTRAFQNVETPATSGLMGSLMPALGTGLGFALGSPIGSAIGGGLTSGASSLFNWLKGTQTGTAANTAARGAGMGMIR